MDINVTTNAQWYEATLEIPSGLTIDVWYELIRRTPGTDPDETIRVWQADNTSAIFTDVTPRVGVDMHYTLHLAGSLPALATSPTVRIPYDPALFADQKLWDTTQGSWPVLRTVTRPWIEPLRLPVADYTAEWGYRATVMQVVGSAYPVVASDVAVMKQGDLVFLTSGNDERRRLVDYVRHNRTVHLASPCVDGLQHMFFRVLGVAETVPVKSRPMLRQWQVRYQQVPRPDWYGITDWAGRRTWADVEAAGTWDDAVDLFGGTWLDWRGQPSTIDHARTTQLVEEGSW